PGAKQFWGVGGRAAALEGHNFLPELRRITADAKRRPGTDGADACGNSGRFQHEWSEHLRPDHGRGESELQPAVADWSQQLSLHALTVSGEHDSGGSHQSELGSVSTAICAGAQHGYGDDERTG